MRPTDIVRALLPVLALTAPLAAQAPSPAREAPAAPPTLRAAPLASAVRIDGRLDDAAWAAAEVTTSFTESYPNAGAPARLRTEARVLYDAEALYVAMRMHDPAPDSIAAQLARRDAGGIYSDWAQVMVDSYYDRRTAFAFGVNPRGVKRDVYFSNDNAEDFGWDAVWEAAAQVDSAGWTAEFRIPFSQLRFSRGEPEGGRTWGLQLTRDIARHQARYHWAPWVRSDNAYVSRFGSLSGLVGVRAPTQLEVQPYAVARMARAPGNPDNPFYHANDASASVGADVRYGLPSGFTLNATVNPDFGQVELDPAIVNLSAYEVRLPERRPFFVEGTDIFRFGNLLSYISQGTPQFFYSRRIGRAPQLGLGGDPDVAFHDTPPATTILGAVKLSGKTANGWSVGVLDALTSREQARVLGADGERRTVPVEPLTNYLAGRVRRDLNGGRTVVGGILTAAHRSQRDSVFEPLLRSDAYVGGIDAEHHWANRMWSASGFVAGSRVGGSADAIAATQRSSARYYRRPDAGYLRYDSTATSLSGHVAGFALRKGGAWRGSLWYQEISPGFEPNDLGFQGRTDTRGLSALFGRRHDRPGRLLRDWFVRAFTSHTWNFGGDLLTNNAALRGNATFKSLWTVNATVERAFPTLDDRLTRGGPIAERPGYWSLTGGVGSDSRKRVSAGVDVGTFEDDAGGHSRYAYGYVQARPSSAVQVTLGPELERLRSMAQYVRARTDALATETFGRRYVFGEMDQTTVALSTRLDWTFSPTLSLQLYARPFISAGDYRGFKELEARRSFRFAEYGRDRGTIELGGECGGESDPGLYAVDPDGPGDAACFTFANPDYNVADLRGSAVL
ncbi:MAG TPA: DUF5916 domain-containing protein, partial [Longimicrobium sp.]|nr:DUF5916 domain-containing protein [Longimicrobium sp.]